jgi:hypothetical protein
MVNGESLESVQEYVYLGHTITSNGKCETEIRKRIGIAKGAFNNMKQVLTNKQISTQLKIRLVKCYIYSTFIYALETWILKRPQRRKLMSWRCGLIEQLIEFLGPK